MSGFPIGTVSDRRHSGLTLETSPDSVIDTLGLPPICVDTFVRVALVTIEALRALFNDLDMLFCGSHLDVSG